MVERQKGSIFFTGATASVRGSGVCRLCLGKIRPAGASTVNGPGASAKKHSCGTPIIDAGVDTEFVRDRLRKAGTDPDYLPPDTPMNPGSIAEAYRNLHHQQRDGWTHELDIRPYAEKW